MIIGEELLCFIGEAGYHEWGHWREGTYCSQYFRNLTQTRGRGQGPVSSR
jgi:hypothetical protein